MNITKRRVLTVALGALLVTGPLSVAQAAPSGAGSAAEVDPCRERPPTELDNRSDWVCAGLATEAPAGPVADESEITDEEARQLASTEFPPDYELGVAVSPDGRLYRQTVPSPPGPEDTPPRNPTPTVEDPEGEPDPEAGSFQIAKIFGADNRQLRLNTTAYPWRVMGAVLPPGSPLSECSGSLIGPRHLLTAGHCIHKGGGGKDSGWFINRKIAPGQKGIGVFPNGLKNHAWYFSVKGWYDHANKAFDYGMIVLEDRNDTAHLGWLGWQTGDHWGGHWTFGYPGADLNCAASPLVSGKCGNFLYGDDNSTRLLGVNMLATRADAQPGQSGSPIYKFNGGNRRVIAVLTAEGSVYNWGPRVNHKRSNNFCHWIHLKPSVFNDHPCQ